MSALTQAQAQAVLAGTLGQAAFPATPGTNVRLMTANGSEAAAGTELAAGGGYTAGGVPVTWAAPTAQTGTYSGRIGNAAVTISNMPAATIVGVEIWSTDAAPRRLFWGALTTSRTTAAGDTLSFPADSLVAQV